MMYFFLTFLFIACCSFLLIAFEIKKKNMGRWLPSYFRQQTRQANGKLTHVMFAFVDHYEPYAGNANAATALRRVKQWHDEYPKMAGQFIDADGRHPQHSFFYPQEEYDPALLDLVSDLCWRNFGEIEIHLHHENDTPQGLSDKITSFTKTLSDEHGALSRDTVTNKPVFAFIHGNWTLDNSASDGSHCGINNEIEELEKLGCYCDFTFPSAPNETQPEKINSIYYAIDDPHSPKSHNDGVDMKVGGKKEGNLLLIQGPLCLNWKWRKWGIIPRIENGDIRNSSPPLSARVDAWIKQRIQVKGKPDWIFVKIHTHGAQEPSFDAVLGNPVKQMHGHLQERYNDGSAYSLHYVSAREMFNIAKAAESGKEGNPNDYRDFILKKPKFRSLAESSASRVS
jgi:hypothetical protein